MLSIGIYYVAQDLQATEVPLFKRF